jgi:hypothetical protein
MRWIASTTSSYIADNGDRLWGLSWEGGVEYPFKTGTTIQSDALRAIAHQAVDIIYRRGGRDLFVPSSWIPLPMYSHLTLADYLDRDVPFMEFVSAADKHRLNWARDPEAFARGEFLPYQPAPSIGKPPYSSSFRLPPALGSTPVSGPDAIGQAGSHRGYSVSSQTEFRGALLSEIAFPAQKVHLYDVEDRYGQEPAYYAPFEGGELNPRPTVLMADGSAGRRATLEANRGWIPAAPTSADFTRFRYQPSPWEASGDSPGTLRGGYYQYTRGGPAGRDFGGPEIDTGQP